MIQTVQGIVKAIIREREDIQEIEVDILGKREKAMNYPVFTGKVALGQQVTLNTTAVKLGLGTGGYHFVMHADSPSDASDDRAIDGDRHIMKLRYTPFQIATGSCEEQNSPFHQQFHRHRTLDGMAALVGELHSMLPVAVTYIKQINPALQIAYIMTDKASLPLSFSRHVQHLKEKGWLAGTVTVGHAFGGDLEAVNIYTGLLAAKHIIKADLAIVIMGPGIVGTGTPYGFTGMEQVEVLHAASSLQGIPILIPRLGRADSRSRHQGVSHHTRAVLEHTLVPVHIPVLEEVAQMVTIPSSIHRWIHGKKERLGNLENMLSHYPEAITTMGRTFRDDPLFYESVAIAADFAHFMACAKSDDLFDAENLARLWTDSTTP